MSAVLSNINRKFEHGSKKGGQKITVLKNPFKILLPVAAEIEHGSIAKQLTYVVRRLLHENDMMGALKQGFNVDWYGCDLKVILDNSQCRYTIVLKYPVNNHIYIAVMPKFSETYIFPWYGAVGDACIGHWNQVTEKPSPI